MKKLELNQMENLEGGLSLSCGLSLAGYGVLIVTAGTATFGLGIAAILAAASVVDSCL